MNEKVTLPKEVAEAIETLRRLFGSNYEVIQRAAKGKELGINSGIVYRHFNGDMDALMSALVNGYRIEKTPEEDVANYHRELIYNGRNDEALCVRVTLDLLGIKIDGVNT